MKRHISKLAVIAALGAAFFTAWATKPVIGISCGHDDGASRLGVAYSNSIARAGAVPLLIPVTTDSAVIADICRTVDAIVMSGGGDVHPSYYGEEMIEECGAPDSIRDIFDMLLARQAIALRKPLLGICRGEQAINIAMGGTLIQDLPAQWQADTLLAHKSPPTSIPSHPIAITSGSWLHKALGADSVDVNSNHHQAVGDIAPGLRAIATSIDGVVEAFEGTGDAVIWGVQFHPEALIEAGDDYYLPILKAFVDSVARINGAIR